MNNDFEGWLREQLASILRVPEDEMKNDVKFSNYGMDSIAAIELAGKIETVFGFPFEAELLYESDTIDRLGQTLSALRITSVLKD